MKKVILTILCLLCFGVTPVAATMITVNPQTGQLNVGGGFSSSVTWNGVRIEDAGIGADGLRQYLVHGDFLVQPGDTVTAVISTESTAQPGVRFIVGNNAILGGTFEFSGSGRRHRLGSWRLSRPRWRGRLPAALAASGTVAGMAMVATWVVLVEMVMMVMTASVAATARRVVPGRIPGHSLLPAVAAVLAAAAEVGVAKAAAVAAVVLAAVVAGVKVVCLVLVVAAAPVATAAKVAPEAKAVLAVAAVLVVLVVLAVVYSKSQPMVLSPYPEISGHAVGMG